MGIGEFGAYWIINEGKASERRVPVKFRPGTPSAAARNVVAIHVENAPTHHLGKPLKPDDAITLCALAANYWEKLADETFAEWWDTG
jgi:hypothetical protein